MVKDFHYHFSCFTFKRIKERNNITMNKTKTGDLVILVGLLLGVVVGSMVWALLLFGKFYHQFLFLNLSFLYNKTEHFVNSFDQINISIRSTFIIHKMRPHTVLLN